LVRGGGANSLGVVTVEAVFAVAAIVTLGGECAGDGLVVPFVFFLAVAPCFVVNALAHLKEEAIGCVSAAVVEVSYPPAATATVADMLAFAFPPVGRVGVGVVTSQFAEVNNGARGGYFGLNRSGEGAFSSA